MERIDAGVIAAAVLLLTVVIAAAVYLQFAAPGAGEGCIYDLIGGSEGSLGSCYLQFERGSYATSVPVDPSECGQLEFACNDSRLVTWEVLGCEPGMMRVGGAFAGCLCNLTGG